MKKISLPVGVGLAAVALVLAAYAGFTSMSAKEYRPPAKALVTDDSRWLRETAKRVGGDPGKLSSEERKRADRITQSHTDATIAYLAKEG